MDDKQKRYLIMRGWCLRVLLFLYDAIMVNLAYFLAIVLRFSDRDSFYNQGAIYTSMFRNFAPYYTILCLVLFLVFRMYGGVWRYAGSNDAKKLVMINLGTCLIYMCGSLLIVGRMPISVYILGAVIQLISLSAPRLLPRYVIDNYGKTKGGSSDVNIPLVLVGVCENTRIIQSKIENDRTNIVKPVCVVDYLYSYTGKTFNGLPVLCGPDAIYDAIKKFNIRSAIIADASLPEDYIKSIKKACEENGIELRDFVIGTDNRFGELEIGELLKSSKGPITVSGEGVEERQFKNAQMAALELDNDSIVDSIAVKDGKLHIIIRKKEALSSGSNGEWIEQYRKETGNEISFF